ncbi:hypothetical protein HBI56_183560 [Parastagonospora nodorum]|nr:hypothetical protein HBH54_009950 [Parastagonospora nodorum]KAH3994134.1 hypothetical protein HBI10_189590 [Parastagonospora nodorum]KAH4013597.1 hypothetical protein HBI13_178420 [Parastagonospora nodorum]KAH4021357.1 hypothetical protein HBI09_177290 [Parastagonospora nodorum]KAH4044988.1 hypothetical protein HBH49_209940 [Parastagonospora nodorum]
MWSYAENEVDEKLWKAVVDVRQTLSKQAEKLGKQAWEVTVSDSPLTVQTQSPSLQSLAIKLEGGWKRSSLRSIIDVDKCFLSVIPWRPYRRHVTARLAPHVRPIPHRVTAA